MQKFSIKESVRNLVEFCLKEGDIDNRFSTNARAIEGTRAHQRLQKENTEYYKNYEKEVYLSYEYKLEECVVIIEGRADGIIVEDDKIIIEEIKSTYKKYSDIADSNELHWAQAKIYGAIYGVQNNIEKIWIRLSYVQLDNNEIKSFERQFKVIELKEFALKLVKEYEKFNKFIYKNKEKRNLSAKEAKFPFEKYREGQKRLVNIVYRNIKEKETLFVQAPTGIGKTISTIFPTIKALGENYGDRILYLTSRTINKEVANEAFRMLRKNGLKFKSITITAKEKSCCNEKFDCNPEVCKYARGYYGKLKATLYEILNEEEEISADILNKYALEYEICPFELSLDLALYCDGIICDYNYVFDPRVSLKRLLDTDGNIVLIDEAHNLVNRGREMYSATITKTAIMECRKITKGRMNKLSSILGKINTLMIQLRNECEHKNIEWFYENKKPEYFEKLLKMCLKESEEILSRGNKFEGYADILELYFDIYSFINIMQMYDENYTTVFKKDKSELGITLFCVNPAKNIKSSMKKTYSAILFSATLTPINYYMEILGGDEKTYRVRLPSPFEKENLKVSISPINIRYAYRDRTINDVLKKIFAFVNEKSGNYIVFCPSYVYIEKLYAMIEIENIENINLIKQNINMSENEKIELLNKFKIKKNNLALCITGGMFSEGIDLPGEELIGCIIVGVGYPRIDFKNEIIKDYYGKKGYDYAYVYPGINKVLQGAGRVIRTENDKGRVLLIDDRYELIKYRTLLPKEWYPIYKV